MNPEWTAWDEDSVSPWHNREPIGRLAGTRDVDDEPAEPEPTQLDHLRAALVDTDGLDRLVDPEPLVGEDVLFKDCLAWMVGKPGCMKSFTALDIAGCVATGEPWQGYQVAQGPVLYVVAEGVRGTKKRVRAWEKAMGQPMHGVQFLPVAVQARNAAGWDALVQLAGELQPVLVVLDTQARLTVGVEENSNTEMGYFVHQAEQLRTACGACVLIIHHIGRSGETGRGATTLDGALSTIIKVAKEDDRVRLECTKNKDGIEWDPIVLRAVPTGDSIVLALDSDLVQSHRGATVAALKMAQLWWQHHALNWVGAGALIDVVAPKTSFYRNCRELQRAGLVELDESGRYPRYRLNRPLDVPDDPAIGPPSHP